MAPSATEQSEVTYEDLIQLEQEFEDADLQISTCGLPGLKRALLTDFLRAQSASSTRSHSRSTRSART